jgi:HSP20 family protein
MNETSCILITQKNQKTMFAQVVNPLLNSIVHELLNDAMHEKTTPRKAPFVKPAANIVEQTENFVITLAVPGLQKEDVSLNLEKDILTIVAEKEVAAAEGTKYNLKELGAPQIVVKC